ncbi:MAG: alpha/beta hydrolase [Candidatus Bathyarchaeia archaeon]
MSFLKLGAIRLYYHEVGQGVPVVFVNGWTNSSEYWMPVVERLKNTCWCILYDMRGFGRSQPIDELSPLDLDQHADDLHQLILHLKASDVHIVAHGLGVWVATIAARLHPQDVISLTAVSPEGEPKAQSDIPSIWQQASLILKDLASVPVLRNLVAWRFRSAPEPFRSKLFEDFAQADRQASFQLLASCMEHERSGRLKKALHELQIPVMIVRGSQDSLCPEEEARALFEAISAGKLATVRGCHHLPMLEFTKEFSDLLIDFICKHSRHHQLSQTL